MMFTQGHAKKTRHLELKTLKTYLHLKKNVMKKIIYLFTMTCLVIGCGLSEQEKRWMEAQDGIYHVMVPSTDPLDVALSKRGLPTKYKHFLTYKLLIDGSCEMIEAADSTEIIDTGTWVPKKKGDMFTIELHWLKRSEPMILRESESGGRSDSGARTLFELDTENLDYVFRIDNGYIRLKREFLDKYPE